MSTEEPRTPQPAPAANEPLPDIEPMTASLMARLFGVPLLIVAVIVGCAVVVVLLFGSITTDQQRSIASLLTVLETSSGEKTAGVLLPNEKELWQVSRELALRLQRKDVELTADELTETADRLAALLSREAAGSEHLTEMGRKRMHFVMRALALTESERAVEPIAALLADGHADTRREALASLTELHEVPSVSRAMPAMLRAVADPDAVVRMTACVALSALAEPGDVAVADALGDAYFDGDREVKWNATLALARLGDARGKSLLLDMLERRYWEEEVPVRQEVKPSSFTEYKLPPGAVSRYLVAAVEAGSHLNDTDVWTQIRALGEDGSAQVREAVRRVVDARESRSNAS